MLAVQAFVNMAVFGTLAWFFLPGDPAFGVLPLHLANLTASAGFLLAGVLVLTLRIRWLVIVCWTGLIAFFVWFNWNRNRDWGPFDGGIVLAILFLYLLAGLAGAIWLPFPNSRVDLRDISRPDWADEGRRTDI